MDFHHQRNYYKCSSEGCNAKKRVERDPEESSYVIRYDGVHNHGSPSVVYYNQMPPPMDPNNIWTCELLHEKRPV
ncbi:hypothetical protein GBA52_020217 [Prunus armeniaca]|nr:hypothetical protein GBA52_020217 [Prunus armeniaca]